MAAGNAWNGPSFPNPRAHAKTREGVAPHKGTNHVCVQPCDLGARGRERLGGTLHEGKRQVRAWVWGYGYGHHCPS